MTLTRIAIAPFAGKCGIAILLNVYYGAKRAKALEKNAIAATQNARVATKNAEIAEQGQITERFTKAIEQPRTLEVFRVSELSVHHLPIRPQITSAVVPNHQVNRRYSTAIPYRALLPVAK